jgi:hypothetical protein
MLGLVGSAAQPNVQAAMTAYDQRRAHVMEAVNAKDLKGVQAALEAAAR